MPKEERDEVLCEVCDEPVSDATDLCGCNDCGKLFGPCCNSDDPDLCSECV